MSGAAISQSSVHDASVSPILSAADGRCATHTEFADICDIAFDDRASWTTATTPRSPKTLYESIPVDDGSVKGSKHSSVLAGFPASKATRNRSSRGLNSDDFFSDPATHNLLSTMSRDSTGRVFNRRRQSTRLLGSAFWHLVSTIFLCEVTAAIMGGFYTKQFMTSSDRRWFNALITGLPLFVGLSVASWLRASSNVLRWRVLASRHWTPRQFDIILGSAEPMNVVRLMLNVRQGNAFATWMAIELVCICWLLLTVVGPLAISLLGFTYDFVQSSTVQLQSGHVSLLDLHHVTLIENATMYSSVNSLTATYNFGDSSDIAAFLGITTTGDCQANSTCDKASATSQYTFQARNPDNSAAVPSTRYITSQVSCSISKEASGNFSQGPPAEIWTGDLAPIADAEADFYRSDREKTGYLTSNLEGSVKCGERCSTIYVFPPAINLTVYICKSSISHVLSDNHRQASLDLPDVTAKQLVTSIANSSQNVLQSERSYNRKNFTGVRYNYFPWGDSDSALFKDRKIRNVTDIDAIMFKTLIPDTLSKYALTVLAAADQGSITPETDQYFAQTKHYFAIPFSQNYAPRTLVPGNGIEQPYYPWTLQVSWWHAMAIITFVPVLQALTSAIIIWFASGVIVKDGSFFSMTNLLAPALSKRVGDRGCLLHGQEIVRLLGDETMTMTYGTRVRGDLNHVGVVEGRLDRPHRKSEFVEGHYD